MVARGGGIGAAPPTIGSRPALRPGAVELGRSYRADGDLVEQNWDAALDESLELGFEVVGFRLEGEDPAGGVAQRDHGGAMLLGVRGQRAQAALLQR